MKAPFLLVASLLLSILVQISISKVVMIDGQKYLDRMNYQILNQHVAEHRIKEGKYVYLLIIANNTESAQYLNLFDTVSTDLMDHKPRVEFLILNVENFPETKKLFNIQDLDIPEMRFYSRGHEIPYTEHFWNRHRMQLYIQERVRNQVQTIETPEQMRQALENENSLVYFHDGSLLPYQDTVMYSLESMACLYHKLTVSRVVDHTLFQMAKDHHSLRQEIELKNKSHFLVYHSPHRGIISKGFPEGKFDFKKMREFYSRHQFAHVLDYGIEVHDFLMVEQSAAVFLVLKEDGPRKLNHVEKSMFVGVRITPRFEQNVELF